MFLDSGRTTDLVFEERQNFDPAGHHGRPDVFRVMVHRTRQEPIESKR